MITKEEIFADIDEDTLNDLFTYDCPIDGFQCVYNEMVGYDEGDVYIQHVVKHTETGRYFSYTSSYNSWTDFGADFSLDEVIEVKPKEKTIIEYVPISKS